MFELLGDEHIIERKLPILLCVNRKDLKEDMTEVDVKRWFELDEISYERLQIMIRSRETATEFLVSNIDIIIYYILYRYYSAIYTYTFPQNTKIFRI